MGANLYGDTNVYLGLRSSAANDNVPFDNVSATAVPEPGTPFFPMVGTAAMFLFRRRRIS